MIYCILEGTEIFLPGEQLPRTDRAFTRWVKFTTTRNVFYTDVDVKPQPPDRFNSYIEFLVPKNKKGVTYFSVEREKVLFEEPGSGKWIPLKRSTI